MNHQQLVAKVEELSAMVTLLAEEVEKLQAQKSTEIVVKPRKTVEGSIADTTVGLLKSGMKPKEVLAAVLEKHPEAKTTIACVYWYKTRVNKGLYPDAE